MCPLHHIACTDVSTAFVLCIALQHEHNRSHSSIGEHSGSPVPQITGPALLLVNCLTRCSAFTASNSATCLHVGHGSQPNLEVPREGLRQGEDRGGGGAWREAEPMRLRNQMLRPRSTCGTMRSRTPPQVLRVARETEMHFAKNYKS